VTLYHGKTLDVLAQLPDGSVDCCVTSPPYFGLRDYGVEGQYGLERSPVEYVETMRSVFADVRRVLAADGTLWLNIGDSYVGNPNSGSASPNRRSGNGKGAAGDAFRVQGLPIKGGGLPTKNLLGIPWRVAFALQDDGWILRNAVIWNKPNAMPESVTDRLSCRYEHVFLFSKSRRYWFDLDSIKVETTGRAPGNTVENRQQYGASTGTDGGARRFGGNPTSTLLDVHERRNPGDVWMIPTSPFAAAHFAVMPPALAERCVRAGCEPGGTVLDPFSGSGTTGLAAAKHGRRYVGIDLNRDYLDMSLRTRLAQSALVDGGAS
jgi:site-specific DNA-methyltransferase (cytosine-N4-specific)